MKKKKKGKILASRFTSSQGPAVKHSKPLPKKESTKSKGAIGFVPYKKEELILTIGDGNFSFSNALATIFEGEASNIVATAYDPGLIVVICLLLETILKQKYEDAEKNISSLTECGGTVLYNIDGTNLEAAKKRKGNEALDAQFDKIVFNFPHVGTKIL